MFVPRDFERFQRISGLRNFFRVKGRSTGFLREFSEWFQRVSRHFKVRSSLCFMRFNEKLQDVSAELKYYEDLREVSRRFEWFKGVSGGENNPDS